VKYFYQRRTGIYSRDMIIVKYFKGLYGNIFKYCVHLKRHSYDCVRSKTVITLPLEVVKILKGRPKLKA
jgi:hypothetical protein